MASGDSGKWTYAKSGLIYILQLNIKRERDLRKNKNHEIIRRGIYDVRYIYGTVRIYDQEGFHFFIRSIFCKCDGGDGSILQKNMEASISSDLCSMKVGQAAEGLVKMNLETLATMEILKLELKLQIIGIIGRGQRWTPIN